jgi:hypothetical protein
MVVDPTSGPNSERTLGYWPDEFKAKYQTGSNVSRLGGERAKALKVAQRLHDQNIEIRTAKSSGREPKIPDVAVRRQRAREDLKALKGIANERLAIEANAITTKEGLKPYDYSKHDPLRQEYRQMLRGATDKERAALLQKPAYRESLFQGDPSLSGVSEQQYEMLWDRELRSKFPDQMQAYDDHATAQEATRLAHEAAHTALINEFKALGEPLEEPGAPAPKPEWE